MGKKRVTYDEDKPPNDHHVPIDHHHHHHHRHHNRQKPKKVKSEAKLLHTLNSHLKKLSKYRSRKLISLSTPPSPNVSLENNKKHHGHLSSWLKNDQNDDWFMEFDFDHDDRGDMGAFEFGQELFKPTSFIGYENNEDLFGGNIVFEPDLNASHNVVMVFEECGLGCYIPDPIMDFDNDDEGRHIYDTLKLSSQEEMINEFLKVAVSWFGFSTSLIPEKWVVESISKGPINLEAYDDGRPINNNYTSNCLEGDLLSHNTE
ncbi:hypothetical protein Hdeb2414_s0023g00627121 [Helianthus debilis subsp. tardiflorus]